MFFQNWHFWISILEKNLGFHTTGCWTLANWNTQMAHIWLQSQRDRAIHPILCTTTGVKACKCPNRSQVFVLLWGGFRRSSEDRYRDSLKGNCAKNTTKGWGTSSCPAWNTLNNPSNMLSKTWFKLCLLNQAQVCPGEQIWIIRPDVRLEVTRLPQLFIGLPHPTKRGIIIHSF